MAAPEVVLELIERFDRNLAAARTEHEQTALPRQIEATDRQIDNLVHELYGFTEEEMGIVEEPIR